MANSNDSVSNAPSRREIKLFDPRQMERRSPSTTHQYPSNHHGTPGALGDCHSMGVPTASSAGGISPFRPASEADSEDSEYQYRPAPRRSVSTAPVSTAPVSTAPVSTAPTAAVLSAQAVGVSPQTPSVRKSGRSRPNRKGVRSPDLRFLVAGSSIVAGLVLVGDVTSIFQSKPVSNVCQEIVQPDAVLSREKLSQLLSIPERNDKAAVRDIVDEPYCVLPSLEIRAGARAEREAYPLAFDPQTWLVLLYEGDEYAGYAFSFQQ